MHFMMYHYLITYVYFHLCIRNNMSTQNQEFIKYHDEDILTELETTEKLKSVEPYSDDDRIKGSFGLMKFVSLNWDLNPAGTVDVWLDLAGQNVAQIHLDKDKITRTLSGNVLVAKASIEVSVNWSTKKLSADGKACYNNLLGWKCASFNKNLITW